MLVQPGVAGLRCCRRLVPDLSGRPVSAAMVGRCSQVGSGCGASFRVADEEDIAAV
jgi:hypothetical protein